MSACPSLVSPVSASVSTEWQSKSLMSVAMVALKLSVNYNSVLHLARRYDQCDAFDLWLLTLNLDSCIDVGCGSQTQ